MSLIIKRYVCSICEPQRELGRVVVFIYKGNSSATAKSKLLVTGSSGGLTSSLARHTPHPCTGPTIGLGEDD